MALALAGRNAEAEDLYRETIEKRIRVLSPADPETASTQYNLGLLLARTERWAEAEELFRSAWVARTASLGEQDRATLRAGSELARTLASLGRLNDSVELDQKILQSRVAVLGEDDRETLSSRNNLAEGLREIGRLKEAKEQTARTLGILRDSEPDVALAMTALWSHANAVHRSGELLSAESEYREALALHRWTLGELDLKTLGVRTNLGALLADKGQAAEAEPFLLELIGDYEKLGRDESADVLRVKHDLAKVYHDAGRYREAQDLFEEVFERRRTLLGEENMETLSTLVGLGSALAELGELEEAQTLFNEAVTSTTYRRNWRIPDVLVARFNVAEVELRRDRPEAAAEILPELLKDAVQTWSNAHEYVGVFRAVYGRCLLRTERTAEAEEQLLEARRVIARDGAAGKYWHEAGQDLIELYASAGEAKADSIRGVLEASAPR
jgi:tetratricopeptide (TPR) repeat protein